MIQPLLRCTVLVLAAALAGSGCTIAPNASPNVAADSTPSDSAVETESPSQVVASPSLGCSVPVGALYATLNSAYTAKAPMDPSTSSATAGEVADAKVISDGLSSVVNFASAEASGLVDVPVSPKSVSASLSADDKTMPIGVALNADSAFLTLPTVMGDATFLVLDVSLDNAPCSDLLVRVSFRLHAGGPSSSQPTVCSDPQQQFAATLYGIYGDAWQAIAPIAVAGTALEPTEPGVQDSIRGFVAPRLYTIDFQLMDYRPGHGGGPLAPRSVVATLTTADGEQLLDLKLDGTSGVIRLPKVTGHATLTLDIAVRTATCQNGIARIAYPIEIDDAAIVGACAPGGGPAIVEVPRPASTDLLFGAEPEGIWTVSQSARYGYWGQGDLVDAFAGFLDLGPAIPESAGSHMTIRPVDPTVSLSVGGLGADAFHWAAIHGPDGGLVDADPSPLALLIKAGPGGSLDLTLPEAPAEYGLMINLGWSAPCIDGAGYMHVRIMVR